MTYMLLKDSKSEDQYLIRKEHISAALVKKADESVVVYLSGGHVLHLTHDQAEQFVRLVKEQMQPA